MRPWARNVVRMDDNNLAGRVMAVADQSARETMIRNLYALITFYLAHPSIPVPTQIDLTHQLPSREALAEIADELGEQVYGAGRSMTHPLPDVPDAIRLHFGVAW
jgi:hypothetical protein